jgi:hypothetical protein
MNAARTHEAIRSAALEEALQAIDNTKDKSGTNYDGQNWLQRASRGDFVASIVALKSRTAPDHFAAAMPDERLVPEGWKLLKNTTREQRNWPEDFEHENGNYSCACHSCLREFTGHKRRVTCKSCAAIQGVAK